MIGRYGLALIAGALLVSFAIPFGMPRPMSAQDLFPTPEGRLGGRMPLPTGEAVPAESLPEDTPAPSGHPLVGEWLLDFAETDRAPAQVEFNEDGSVTLFDAHGNRGAGVWMSSDPQSGVLALTVREADESDRPQQIAILQGPVEVGTAGDAGTLNFTYTVETVDGSGAHSESAGPFTAMGQRAD